MKTNTYSVTNMSCGSCKAKIEAKVNALDGIQTAEVSVSEKNLVVTFDQTLVTNENIIDAVSDAGYIAELN